MQRASSAESMAECNSKNTICRLEINYDLYLIGIAI